MSNDNSQNNASGNIESMALSDQAEPMVVIDHVSMVFNMANEQISNLKEYVIKIAKRELMFKEFKALDDVSFTVNRGDVFGLMGTNGSGKSTLLKIVAGVLEPSSGLCDVRGTIAPLIELGAGFDMELTARENIYLNGALLGYSKQFIEDHFDSIVEFADVDGFLDMPMKNYSSGMVARIAFAIATEVVPDILIVDEVLSVGDFMFKEKCERRIKSLIDDHGVTVLIVSHDSGVVERLCNKAIWIEKGVTKALGDAGEVCDLYRLLGGHSGSQEAADKVQSIFERRATIPPHLSRTVFAESRYAMAVKLAEGAETSQADDVLLAPGDSEQICAIANSLAGLLNAFVILYRKDFITDATLAFLQEKRPKRIILFEDMGLSHNGMRRLIDDEIGCVVETIKGDGFDEIAINAFEFGKREGLEWSHDFIITHQTYITDRIALSSYAYKNKIPVFFHERNGVIGASTIEAINANSCNDLLIVGGTVSLPDECLDALKVSGEKRRFCYKGGYEAGIEIARWVMSHDSSFTLAQPMLVSALEVGNALTVGAFAASRNSVILFEDPRNLESVVAIFDYLNSNKDKIEELVFVGDSETYNKRDRTILAKALVLQGF